VALQVIDAAIQVGAQLNLLQAAGLTHQHVQGDGLDRRLLCFACALLLSWHVLVL
jgi:hypothetical protein